MVKKVKMMKMEAPLINKIKVCGLVKKYDLQNKGVIISLNMSSLLGQNFERAFLHLDRRVKNKKEENNVKN